MNLALLKTEVDLADFSGENVTFRFRFGCDNSVNEIGWWIDDVEVIQGCQCVNEDIFADDFESGNPGNWSRVVGGR